MVPGCGDDGGDGDGGDGDDKGGSGGSSAGDSGSGGSAGKGGTTGKGGAAGNSGSSGSNAGGGGGEETGGAGGAGGVGSGGEAGAPGGAGGSTGGSSSGTGGSSGGPSDPQSTACSAFPETVTLGETIQADTFGAVLCTPGTTKCRLTTNTYSDGVNPCANADSAAMFFTSDPGMAGVEHRVTLNSMWHVHSATAGTINSSFDYLLEGVPSGQAVTMVIRSPDNTEYEVVFQFGSDKSFTITSVTTN